MAPGIAWCAEGCGPAYPSPGSTVQSAGGPSQAQSRAMGTRSVEMLSRFTLRRRGHAPPPSAAIPSKVPELLDDPLH